jgi:hypothetical protein
VVQKGPHWVMFKDLLTALREPGMVLQQQRRHITLNHQVQLWQAHQLSQHLYLRFQVMLLQLPQRSHLQLHRQRHLLLKLAQLLVQQLLVLRLLLLFKVLQFLLDHTLRQLAWLLANLHLQGC